MQSEALSSQIHPGLINAFQMGTAAYPETAHGAHVVVLRALELIRDEKIGSWKDYACSRPAGAQLEGIVRVASRAHTRAKVTTTLQEIEADQEKLRKAVPFGWEIDASLGTHVLDLLVGEDSLVSKEIGALEKNDPRVNRVSELLAPGSAELDLAIAFFGLTKGILMKEGPARSRAKGTYIPRIIANALRNKHNPVRKQRSANRLRSNQARFVKNVVSEGLAASRFASHPRFQKLVDASSLWRPSEELASKHFN